MKRVLIAGATSAIAVACAREWASGGARFALVGRNDERLRTVAGDLRARGAEQVSLHPLDLNAFDAHAGTLDACFDALGQVDIALIAHGTLPDQSACESSPALALHEFSTNGSSVIALLVALAPRMQAQRCGSIAVITSVAGDRGRPSNYLYGSAKAAVTTFCEGLRAHLFRAGVHVATIKPGFVDTPMTSGLSLPRLLLVGPERVARDIVRGIERGKDVIYTPWFWRWIMRIVCAIPGSLFKRIRT